MRFTAFQDPCDQWMVYDLFSDLPAELSGRPLLGLAKNEAEQLTEQANMDFVPAPAEYNSDEGGSSAKRRERRASPSIGLAEGLMIVANQCLADGMAEGVAVNLLALTSWIKCVIVQKYRRNTPKNTPRHVRAVTRRRIPGVQLMTICKGKVR